MKTRVRIGAEGVPEEKLHEIVQWNGKHSYVGNAICRSVPLKTEVEIVYPIRSAYHKEETMELKDFIERALDALQQQYYRVLKGITNSELTWQPFPNANSIGFIFWHVTRVEDRLIVHFAQGRPEVWIRDGWHQRWGIPEETTGLEYPPEQVAGFPVPELEEMQAYFEAVRHETLTYLKKLDAKGFEVCPSRTPYPESKLAVAFFQNFTVGHTFCQLIGETNQHLGQVAYIRGLQKNLDKS